MPGTYTRAFSGASRIPRKGKREHQCTNTRVAQVRDEDRETVVESSQVNNN